MCSSVMHMTVQHDAQSRLHLARFGEALLLLLCCTVWYRTVWYQILRCVFIGEECLLLCGLSADRCTGSSVLRGLFGLFGSGHSWLVCSCCHVYRGLFRSW